MNGTIERIGWSGLGLKGTLGTEYLPVNLVGLRLQENRLEGNFSIEDLPQSLKRLELQGNLFSGPINLKALPRDLCYLNLFFKPFSWTD